jgi:glutamate racemase
MKIGVFDSGIGGLSVVEAIKKTLPDEEVIFKNDTKNVPYGAKTPEQLFGLVLPILNQLAIKDGCQVIVIACNTVSTTIIDKLRKELEIPLVAMEPMIKPASRLTKTNKVTVCATPTTLKSKRYKQLKDLYGKGIEFVEPDCSDWSYMIETNNVDSKKIAQIVNDSCRQGSDVIVLACTHYHWIEDIIVSNARGRAVVIQPEEPVVKQLMRVLEQFA